LLLNVLLVMPIPGTCPSNENMWKAALCAIIMNQVHPDGRQL